jgi:hypothetical protein
MSVRLNALTIILLISVARDKWFWHGELHTLMRLSKRQQTRLKHALASFDRTIYIVTFVACRNASSLSWSSSWSSSSSHETIGSGETTHRRHSAARAVSDWHRVHTRTRSRALLRLRALEAHARRAEARTYKDGQQKIARLASLAAVAW